VKTERQRTPTVKEFPLVSSTTPFQMMEKAERDLGAGALTLEL
jgi:hypothetical protein